MASLASLDRCVPSSRRSALARVDTIRQPSSALSDERPSDAMLVGATLVMGSVNGLPLTRRGSKSGGTLGQRKANVTAGRRTTTTGVTAPSPGITTERGGEPRPFGSCVPAIVTLIRTDRDQRFRSTAHDFAAGARSNEVSTNQGRCLLKNFLDRLFLVQHSYPGPSGEDADTGSVNLAMSDHRPAPMRLERSMSGLRSTLPTFRQAPKAQHGASKRSRYAGS